MTDFKEPHPKHNPFHCSADWHFPNSAVMLKIYHLAGAITHGGQEGRSFFASKEKVAKHFGFGYDSVVRAFRMLCRHGWLIQREHNHYLYITHEVWAKTHPDRCVVRELYHWQETLGADPLVGRLYAASTGRLRLREGHVKRLNAVNSDKLVELYVKELAAAAERKRSGSRAGTSNESCLWRVFKHLEGLEKYEKQMAELRKKQAEPVHS